MVLTQTPDCDLGQIAPDFKLLGVDNKHWALADCIGEKGVLVMFICNHCPYVKAIQTRLVEETLALKNVGIHAVAIMSNDPTDYAEDSFANMQQIAKEYHYPFPYLFDETQTVAKAYGAVCTPDFFGYNQSQQLQYRGRLDDGGMNSTPTKRELVEAMTQIANTGLAPKQQFPSIGCSIKWQH